MVNIYVNIFNKPTRLPSGELTFCHGKIHHFIAGKIHYFYGHFPWQNVSSPEGKPSTIIKRCFFRQGTKMSARWAARCRSSPAFRMALSSGWRAAKPPTAAAPWKSRSNLQKMQCFGAENIRKCSRSAVDQKYHWIICMYDVRRMYKYVKKYVHTQLGWLIQTTAKN